MLRERRVSLWRDMSSSTIFLAWIPCLHRVYTLNLWCKVIAFSSDSDLLAINWSIPQRIKVFKDKCGYLKSKLILKINAIPTNFSFEIKLSVFWAIIILFEIPYYNLHLTTSSACLLVKVSIWYTADNELSIKFLKPLDTPQNYCCLVVCKDYQWHECHFSEAF